MNWWARVWCAVWLAAATLAGAPLLDEPVAALTLLDGTVLRQAQAKGFLTKVVLVRHAEGVRTVPYELFPEEYKAALALKRQATVAAAARQEQRQQEQHALQPRPGPSTPASKWDLPAGCRLTLTGGTDKVIILNVENLSDFTVAVHPWQIVARTQAGRVVSGAHWVGLNGDGQVVMTLRSRQLIDGRSEVTLALAISPAIEGDGVVSVQWR